MYRIELSPGEETAFRSIEELAVAIRRGVVTPRARVWHNSSSKWLPIQFHPHFKIASSMQLTQADLVAGPPVKPLELLTLGEMVDAPAPVRLPKEPVRAKERDKRPPPDDPQPRKKRSPKTPRSPRSGRPLRVALAGALLIGGAHLAFTAASAALSKYGSLGQITHRRLIAAPITETHNRPETTTAGVLPIPAVARPGTRSGNAARPRPTPPLPSKSAIEDDETRLPEYTAAEPEQRSASLSAELPLTAAPDIQAAPSPGDITVPAPVAADSLTSKLVDSTGKKAMKGILRAIGGPAPSEKKPAKR